MGHHGALSTAGIRSQATPPNLFNFGYMSFHPTVYCSNGCSFKTFSKVTNGSLHGEKLKYKSCQRRSVRIPTEEPQEKNKTKWRL